MRKTLFGTLGWILLSAALLFMFFIVLSGVTDTAPLRQTYFLRADTSGIAGARDITQWTFFYVCGLGNRDCGKPVPALPFGYAWSSGGEGAPNSLRGSHAKNTTSTHFYYLWRFGWVFFLMGMTLAALGFISGCLYCVRILNKITGLLLTFALFWYSLGVTMMTAEFVQARNRFRSAGRSASLGSYAFGFAWASWACLFLSIIFFFIAGKSDRDNKYLTRKERRTSGTSSVPASRTRGRFNMPFGKRRNPSIGETNGALDKETV